MILDKNGPKGLTVRMAAGRRHPVQSLSVAKKFILWALCASVVNMFLRLYLKPRAQAILNPQTVFIPRTMHYALCEKL